MHPSDKLIDMDTGILKKCVLECTTGVQNPAWSWTLLSCYLLIVEEDHDTRCKISLGHLMLSACAAMDRRIGNMGENFEQCIIYSVLFQSELWKE